MKGKSFEEEYNRLLQEITGLQDPELQHEAMKLLIAQLSLNKEF